MLRKKKESFLEYCMFNDTPSLPKRRKKIEQSQCFQNFRISASYEAFNWRVGRVRPLLISYYSLDEMRRGLTLPTRQLNASYAEIISYSRRFLVFFFYQRIFYFKKNDKVERMCVWSLLLINAPLIFFFL